MGTITAIQTDQQVGYTTVYTWDNFTTAGSDVGSAAYVGHLLFLSAHVDKKSGTFTQVELQGSFDGVNWGTLGTAAFLLNADGQTRAIADPPLFIRPANQTGASGVTTIYVLGKRAD